MSRTRILSILFLFAAACSTFALATRAQAGPHLVVVSKVNFPETEFNFGTIDEGIQVKHIFKIENKGGKRLIIKTAFSTCGCTIPKIKKKEIDPGESGDLEVVMDTSMKQGDVTKPIEVYTNDPVTPISTLYIKAHVKSPHGELGAGDRTAKIFTGRCAACHVAKGVGKMGEQLYVADCAMCHGFRAKGIPSVGPMLIPFDYHDKESAAARREVISHGSKIHRSMPGFAKEAGGPLTDKEIDSLMDFLKDKSDSSSKE